MRLAIAVVALSFASGVALAALGILVDRDTGTTLASQPAPHRERAAVEVSTSVGNLASHNPPIKSIVINDNAVPFPGWVPGSAAVELQLTGIDYRWEICYLPAPGRSYGKSQNVAARASQEIHLPAEADVRLHLKSRDFVYLVMLPDLDGGLSQKSQIAVPNHHFTLDFNTGAPGTLVLSGDHLCGLPRPSLNLTVVVESASEFQAWIDDQRS